MGQRNQPMEAAARAAQRAEVLKTLQYPQWFEGALEKLIFSAINPLDIHCDSGDYAPTITIVLGSR